MFHQTMLKHKKTRSRLNNIIDLQTDLLNDQNIYTIYQYPIFENITFCKYIFVNNFFVNGVFDDFENIHVLKNKNIKILSIFYYHT